MMNDSISNNAHNKYKFHSHMTDIFGFSGENILKCGNCDHILKKESQEYSEISIDLSQMKDDFKKSMKENSNPELFYLNDCLNYYFFQQKANEDSNELQIHCPKCNKIPKTITKTHDFKTFPNYLCIHLNRFSRKSKQNIFVEFPTDDLSLGDFYEVQFFNYWNF